MSIIIFKYPALSFSGTRQKNDKGTLIIALYERNDEERAADAELQWPADAAKIAAHPKLPLNAMQ
jgi:hypothetical protein